MIRTAIISDIHLTSENRTEAEEYLVEIGDQVEVELRSEGKQIEEWRIQP